jgi:hypothetical protein
MTEMRNKLMTFVAVAMVLASAGVVSAQGIGAPGVQVQPFYSQYIGKAVTAVTTDVAFYVKYVGPTAQAATVAVAAADSDVTLTVAAANDATVNIQAGGLGPCGASVGVLDTADTDCDTLGELVDHINASANWRAAIVTGLRADTTANTLFTVASTDAKAPTGVAVLWETPQRLSINVPLLPYSDGQGAFSGYPAGTDLGISNFLARDTNTLRGGFLATRPFADKDFVFQFASENVTSTGAVGQFIVYCSYDNYSNQGKQQSGTQNDIVLYQEAGAATTVTGKIDEFVAAGGLVCSGGRLWVRISATTDLTAPTVLVTGYSRAKRLQ